MTRKIYLRILLWWSITAKQAKIKQNGYRRALERLNWRPKHFKLIKSSPWTFLIQFTED